MNTESIEEKLRVLKTRFDICERRVCLPGVDLRIAAVSSAGSLVTDKTDPDKLPFWAELWPASSALAAYLLKNSSLQGKTCLELGCGVGLAGLAARIAGAEVLQTDYFPEALEFAALNAALNGITGIKRVVADWRSFPLKKKFDLVIGADVLYERSVHDMFVNTLRSSMHDDSIAVIADPFRIPAWDLISRLEAEGWGIETIEHNMEWEGKVANIILCIMRLPISL